MAVTKKYDLAVKVSEYTDRDGKTKGRYENVGAVLIGDNGPFITLKKTFNPAGVPTAEGKDSIIISCFEPKDNEKQRAADAGFDQPAPAANKPAAGAKPAQDFEDDIPF